MRLFFALWPDAAAAGALERLAGEVVAVAGGRAMPKAKIHLTLAFLGEVAQPAHAHDVAEAIRTKPFVVRLDCVGSFRRARVSWAGMLAPDPELMRLQAKLEEGLRARGYPLEERPFAAHVTLARKADKALPTAAIAPIEWRARELTLVRSMPGTGDYVVTKGWKLK